LLEVFVLAWLTCGACCHDADFGMRLPPPINSLERLQQKIALLEVGACRGLRDSCGCMRLFLSCRALMHSPPLAMRIPLRLHAFPAQTLGEVHVAAGVLQQSRAARRSVHPLDSVHTALRCNIAPLGEADEAMGFTIKQ
jgi:hypothetical protein